jgi:hypothetical protein
MTIADGVVGGGVEVAAGVVTENQSSHAHTTVDDCSSMPRPVSIAPLAAPLCGARWRAAPAERSICRQSMLNAVALPIAMMSMRAALLDGSDVMRGSAAAQAETATLAAVTPARTGDRRRT